MLVVGGGALACLSTLLPWYGISWTGGATTPASTAWAGIRGTTGLVALVAGMALIIAGVRYASLPVTERPAPLRWAMMGGAWVLVLSAILGPGEIVDVTSDALEAAAASGAALHRGGAIGSIVALVAGLIAMAGAWLTIVENTSRHTVHESMTGGPRRRRDR
ncbi:MAG: hypothetical protein ACXWX5_04715 [Actinomycetota bacterium]